MDTLVKIIVIVAQIIPAIVVTYLLCRHLLVKRYDSIINELEISVDELKELLIETLPDSSFDKMNDEMENPNKETTNKYRDMMRGSVLSIDDDTDSI